MKPALIALAGIAALALAGPDALGRLALRAGLDRPAAILLSDPAGRGVALYGAGDHAAADAAFAQAGRSQTFNRGLSLAATGDYPLSVAYFDAMLFANPADEQARRNRDLVAAMYPPHQGDSIAPGRIRGAGGLRQKTCPFRIFWPMLRGRNGSGGWTPVAWPRPTSGWTPLSTTPASSCACASWASSTAVPSLA
ncbi:hypothetical protein ACFSYD_05630 [Paracoccus aerius]